MNRLCVVCAYLAHKPGAKSLQDPAAGTMPRAAMIANPHLDKKQPKLSPAVQLGLFL